MDLAGRHLVYPRRVSQEVVAWCLAAAFFHQPVDSPLLCGNALAIVGNKLMAALFER